MSEDLVTFSNYSAFSAQKDFHQSISRYKLYGGAMGGGNLTASVSGNSLLFVLNQAARNQRMNFG